MEMNQTHASEAGVASVMLPALPGVYFLGGDDVVTDWSLAKFGTQMFPKATSKVIRYSARALQSGQEAYAAHHRLLKTSKEEGQQRESPR